MPEIIDIHSNEFNFKFENYIPYIEKYVEENDKLLIEGNIFREYFELHNIESYSVYNKIRYIFEKLEINLAVKIHRNIILDKKNTFILEFYFESKKEELSKKTAKEAYNRRIGNIKRINEEIRMDVINTETSKHEIINDISTNIPLPKTLICFRCKKKIIVPPDAEKCPKCDYIIVDPYVTMCNYCNKKIILLFPETNCPFCMNLILEWKI